MVNMEFLKSPADLLKIALVTFIAVFVINKGLMAAGKPTLKA